MVYYEYLELLAANEELRGNHCRHLEPHENKRWYFGMLEPAYLNITIPRLQRNAGQDYYYSHEQFNASAFYHEAYKDRHGFNFTYEMREENAEEAVDGEQYAHLSDCSLNGVPVLRKIADKKYRFSCRCPEGTTGDQCQWGDLCNNTSARVWCSNRGECRHIGGQSICVCDEGYHGKVCQHHYSSISTVDNSCGGIKQCQHNCHMRIVAGQRQAFCSCRAGYNSYNETHCVTAEEWDLNVLLKVPENKLLEKSEVRYKVKEILRSTGHWNEAMNFSFDVQTEPGELRVQLSIFGLQHKKRLMERELWEEEFGSGFIFISSDPKLSVGPVSAEFAIADALVLTCPVYGGKRLHISWYKDGNLVYAFNMSDCSYERKTSRLQVSARQGVTENECAILLWVNRPEEVDHGTYTCSVTDRHYQINRRVIAGINNTLHISIIPYVQFVNVGENANVDCLTSNREWIDSHHYSGRWQVIPQDGFSFLHPKLLPGQGFTLDIFNITKALEVKCYVKEEEEMIWMPGMKYGTVTKAATVKLVPPHSRTCPEHVAYGTKWHLTPVNEMDETSCPRSYRGKASRWCRTQHSSLVPYWGLANFSSCVYEPFEYIRTPLLLYGRGYESLNQKLEDLAKDFNTTLRLHGSSLLPGEGSSILSLLNLFLTESKDTVSLSLFFSIIHNVVKEKDAVLAMDAWRMVELVRKYLMRYMVTKLNFEGDPSCQYPYLTAKAQFLNAVGQDLTLSVFSIEETEISHDLAKGNVLENVDNVSIILSDDKQELIPEYEEEPDAYSVNRNYSAGVHLKVVVEIGNKETGEDQKREWIMPNHTMRGQSLGVGVVVYLYPRITFFHSFTGSQSISTKAPILVKFPVVDVVSSLARSNGSFEKDHDNSTHNPARDEFSAKLSVISHLTYSICPDTPPGQNESSELDTEWRAVCGKANFSDGKIYWDLSKCSIQTSTNGTCICKCIGQGLFSLLLLRTTKAGHERSGNGQMGLPAVGISCSVSVVIMLITITLLLPKHTVLSVQLRIIKCASFGVANVLFAIMAWCSLKVQGAGMMACISFFLIICSGIGICQQMAFLQHLMDIPHTSLISPTNFTIGAVVLLSLVTGTVVWGLENICQYKMSSMWLPLGDAWPLSATVLAILLILSATNVSLVIYNLHKLDKLHISTPHLQSAKVVSERVHQAVVLLVGEWLYLCCSFFYNHTVGCYFFSIASVLQSLMLKLMFLCSTDELNRSHCCTLPRQGNFQALRADGDYQGIGGRTEGCMGTLMACRIPPSSTYAELAGNGNMQDEDSEFRIRRGSMWSQTTTTLALSENGEVLQSPTDLNADSRNRATNYLHRNNSLCGAARRPWNFSPNGVDFVNGEDLFPSNENCVPGTRDERLFGKRRHLSFSLHQPVIHEIPFETCQDLLENGHAKSSKDAQENSSQKYLDMTVTTKHRLTRGKPNSLLGKSNINVPRQSAVSSIQKHRIKTRITKKLRHYVNVCDEPASLASRNKQSTSHQYLSMTVRNIKAFSQARIANQTENKPCENGNSKSFRENCNENSPSVEDSSNGSFSHAEASSPSDGPLSTYNSDNRQFPSLSSSESYSRELSPNSEERIAVESSPFADRLHLSEPSCNSIGISTKKHFSDKDISVMKRSVTKDPFIIRSCASVEIPRITKCGSRTKDAAGIKIYVDKKTFQFSPLECENSSCNKENGLSHLYSRGHSLCKNCGNTSEQNFRMFNDQQKTDKNRLAKSLSFISIPNTLDSSVVASATSCLEFSGRLNVKTNSKAVIRKQIENHSIVKRPVLAESHEYYEHSLVKSVSCEDLQFYSDSFSSRRKPL